MDLNGSSQNVLLLGPGNRTIEQDYFRKDPDHNLGGKKIPNFQKHCLVEFCIVRFFLYFSCYHDIIHGILETIFSYF